MTTNSIYPGELKVNEHPVNSTQRRFAGYCALVVSLLTAITFGFAITAIPVSGANCTGDCVSYPYLNTVGQFPKDFIWMPLAILQVLAYVVLMSSIHANTTGDRKIFSQAALSVALLAGGVLAVDYFIQFSVTPISLMYGETEGLPLIIQYNPHGVFIALEELGYLLMNLSFLFSGLGFAGPQRLETAVRWIFMVAFFLALAALIGVSSVYGLDRQDRFEVMVISIAWLALLVNGVLLGRLYLRQSRQPQLEMR